MEYEQISKDFALLKKIISPHNSIVGRADLSKIEKLIFTDIPETLRDNAPANFPQLYFDFKSEYERFKDFILYDKLIGKNVVALGGGFSSGKSSFLNSLMGKRILPANINPSTSVPAYLVHDDEISVYGINAFDSCVELELSDIKAISHSFGEDESTTEHNEDDYVSLGHILNRIFISTPEQRFANLAMLDTPGYSKPEDKNHSAKTDEQIARVQLNSSNYILWFIPAHAGTITQQDIEFISTINKDIPKLIIVNMADSVNNQSELPKIIEHIKDVLAIKGISYVDVLAYSKLKGEKYEYDTEKIIAQLEKWNTAVYESRFAYNFKVIFTKCKEYYDEQIENEGKRLNRLNTAATLTTDNKASESLESLIKESKRNKTDFDERRKKLKELQTAFFTEIKKIADTVNISMPEPSEIDLISDKIVDPNTLLEEYCTRHNIKKNPTFESMLMDAFADVHNEFEKTNGGSEYANELASIIEGVFN